MPQDRDLPFWKVPKGRPDEGLVPDRMTAVLVAEDDDIPARALAWCAAMQTVFEDQEYWRLFAGFRFATYGFFYSITDPVGAEFGCVVYTATERREGLQPWTELAGLLVGDTRFPIVERAGWRFHLSTATSYTVPHPLGGTTTAWARKENGVWMLLTAAHIAAPDLGGINVGDSIPLADGTYATIYDVAPPGVDAMLLRLPDDFFTRNDPPSGALLTVENLIAPYSDVIVEGGLSGQVATKIMAVTDTRGSLNPYNPMRIFLADPCRGGDSGSLTSLVDGRAVGIYTAALGHPSGGHPPEGVCQHLGQAAYCLGLELAHI